jgi:hypothetical protein
MNKDKYIYSIIANKFNIIVLLNNLKFYILKYKVFSILN